MKCFRRVHSLGAIPIIGADGQQLDSFRVEGRMALPLSIEWMPSATGAGVNRFYLSFALGELAYLHEQVPVA